MRTVRNEKGRQIEEVLRKEKGNDYVNDYGYMIYWILDEMRNKRSAEKEREAESHGQILENIIFDFAEINTEEVKELIEYGIKVKKNYTATYPEMSVEYRLEQVKQAIHDEIFDTGTFLRDTDIRYNFENPYGL